MFLIVGGLSFGVSTLIIACCWQSKWLRQLQSRLGVTRPLDGRSWLLLGSWFAVLSVWWWLMVAGRSEGGPPAWSWYVLLGICAALLPVLLLVGGGLYLKAGLAVASAVGAFIVLISEALYAATTLHPGGEGLEVIVVIMVAILLLGIAAAFLVAGLLNSIARAVKGRA